MWSVEDDVDVETRIMPLSVCVTLYPKTFESVKNASFHTPYPLSP